MLKKYSSNLVLTNKVILCNFFNYVFRIRYGLYRWVHRPNHSVPQSWSSPGNSVGFIYFISKYFFPNVSQFV